MKKHAKVEVSSGEVHEVDYDEMEFLSGGLMVFGKVSDSDKLIEVAVFSCHSLISCTITDNE